MTFTNPRKVKVTTLSEHFDYWSWPCISGESFAPNFVGGAGGAVAGYSSYRLYPSVNLTNGGGTTNAIATWPTLPLYSLRTPGVFTGLTVTWQMAFRTSAPAGAPFFDGVEFGIGIAGGLSLCRVIIFRYDTTNIEFQASINNHGGTASLRAYDAGWHSYAFTITAAGVWSFYVDGVLDTTATDNGTNLGAPALLPVISASTGVAAGAHQQTINVDVASLYVAYPLAA